MINRSNIFRSDTCGSGYHCQNILVVGSFVESMLFMLKGNRFPEKSVWNSTVAFHCLSVFQLCHVLIKIGLTCAYLVYYSLLAYNKSYSVLYHYLRVNVIKAYEGMDKLLCSA